MNGKEMMKLLEHHGWKLKTMEGSHHRFMKDGFPKDVIVPVHGKKDLKIGIERKILKQTELLHYWKNRKGGKNK